MSCRVTRIIVVTTFINIYIESGGLQEHRIRSGHTVKMECSFQMTDFHPFRNPIVWIKTQLEIESSIINVMGVVSEPFLSTKRFSISPLRVTDHINYSTSLQIQALQPADNGNYTCEVRNEKSGRVFAVQHLLYVVESFHSLGLMGRISDETTGPLRCTDNEADSVYNISNKYTANKLNLQFKMLSNISTSSEKFLKDSDNANSPSSIKIKNLSGIRGKLQSGDNKYKALPTGGSRNNATNQKEELFADDQHKNLLFLAGKPSTVICQLESFNPGEESIRLYMDGEDKTGMFSTSVEQGVSGPVGFRSIRERVTLQTSAFVVHSRDEGKLLDCQVTGRQAASVAVRITIVDKAKIHCQTKCDENMIRMFNAAIQPPTVPAKSATDSSAASYASDDTIGKPSLAQYFANDATTTSRDLDEREEIQVDLVALAAEDNEGIVSVDTTTNSKRPVTLSGITLDSGFESSRDRVIVGSVIKKPAARGIGSGRYFKAPPVETFADKIACVTCTVTSCLDILSIKWIDLSSSTGHENGQRTRQDYEELKVSSESPWIKTRIMHRKSRGVELETSLCLRHDTAASYNTKSFRVSAENSVGITEEIVSMVSPDDAGTRWTHLSNELRWRVDDKTVRGSASWLRYNWISRTLVVLCAVYAAFFSIQSYSLSTHL